MCEFARWARIMVAHALLYIEPYDRYYYTLNFKDQSLYSLSRNFIVTRVLEIY